MSVSTIYVNLPIKDLAKTKHFWSILGFTFNQDFSDEKALCLELKKDTIYVMLITEEFFSTFTNRPIADGSSTQVLNALQVESREEVDNIMKLALENGATKYREAKNEGWMYYDSFADLDGHQWEIMCIIPQES